MPAHNESLAGDTLTSLSLNFEWRKIIVAALDSFWLHSDLGQALLNEDMFNNFILDVYNFEANVGQKITLFTKVLPVAQTFTGAFTDLGGSDFQHIFTKSKAKITCHNIDMVHSGAGSGNAVFARIAIAGEVVEDENFAALYGNYRRTGDAMAYYENLSLGDFKTIKLQGGASGPTGTISHLSGLLYVIEEFD